VPAQHRSTPACGATPQCVADGQGRAGRACAVPFLRLAPCPAAAPEVGLSRRCRRPGAAPPVVCFAAVLMGSIPNPWVQGSDRSQTHGLRDPDRYQTHAIFFVFLQTSGTSAASLSESSCLLHESRTNIIVIMDLRSPVESAHDSASRIGVRERLDLASAPASRRRARFSLRDPAAGGGCQRKVAHAAV
jgi:hypothetical protein